MMLELEVVSNTVDSNNQSSFILDRRERENTELSTVPSKTFYFKIIYFNCAGPEITLKLKRKKKKEKRGGKKRKEKRGEKKEKEEKRKERETQKPHQLGKNKKQIFLEGENANKAQSQAEGKGHQPLSAFLPCILQGSQTEKANCRYAAPVGQQLG